MFEYNCKVKRIVDGDTLDAYIDLGFDVWVTKRIRFMGIDTPESRTRDKVEKKFGLAAKSHVKDMLPIGSIQILKTEVDKSGEDAKGKFGRILGDFLLDQDDGSIKRLTEIMIEDGHAVPYFGGSKEEVDAAHMRNRERLIEEGVVVL